MNKRYNNKLYSAERYEYLQKLNIRKRRRRIKIAAFFSVVTAFIILTLVIFKINSYNKKAVQTSADTAVTFDNSLTSQKPEPTDNTVNSEFKNIYYAEDQNTERYKAYASVHPELSKEDIVWQVNSYLDYEFYNHDVPADTSSPYIIVNKYYKVPDNYTPSNLVSSDGYQMTEQTAQAYQDMKRDASQSGFRITVVSAFRTVDYQRGLYNSYLANDSKGNVDRYSARPGYSEHHTGMAIDIVGSFGSLGDFINTPESRWIYDNAYKYGFIVRYWTDIEKYTGYENEPWHLRYLGVDIATDMHNKGMRCFEEYKVKYIDHKLQ